MKLQCPVCGEHAVVSETEIVRTNRHGKELEYVSHYSGCGKCEFVFVTDVQMRTNNRSLLEAEYSRDGLPTADALRVWRKKWKFTQGQAGRLLGVGPTAFSKYENYELRPSAPTERLLHLMISSDDAVRLLAKRYGISLVQRQSKGIDTLSRKAVITRRFEQNAEQSSAAAAQTRYAYQQLKNAKQKDSSIKDEVTL